MMSESSACSHSRPPSYQERHDGEQGAGLLVVQAPVHNKAGLKQLLVAQPERHALVGGSLRTSTRIDGEQALEAISQSITAQQTFGVNAHADDGGGRAEGAGRDATSVECQSDKI